MEFENCTADCGTYFGLMHCVNGWCEEVGDMSIKGGQIRTKEASFLIKSHNAIIAMEDVDIESAKGVLVHTILNSDPCKTPVDEKAYGVNVRFTNMSVKGDILHEDSERPMWLDLSSAILSGGIVNANLSLDAGSRFIAEKDSSIHLMKDIDLAQIDAIMGVTITATGSVNGSYRLASGGRLEMREG